MPSLWIFGYGSLIWRPDFSYSAKNRAKITGFARRFWQGSTDHRGTPNAPGRVVTLVEDQNSSCEGMAFKLPQSSAEAIIQKLDYRERGGYTRVDTTIELQSSPQQIEQAVTYIARPTNPNYLGPASSKEIAMQIRHAVGPSGPNLDYIYKLATELRRCQIRDEHVFEIERWLLELDQ